MSPTTALQFSGGKDSRVLLHLYRNQLNDILVVWCNTGAAYPDTVLEMAELAKKVPHFLEVKSDQPKHISMHGYPADVIPLHFTPLGKVIVKKPEHFRIQDAFSCCSVNIWAPISRAMLEHGIKKVIRGQRNSEQYTGPAKHGFVDENGIEYVLPLETWTEEQVFAYLREHNLEIPAYYATENTSHDCWSCTAYLTHAKQRIHNLPGPQRTEVLRRLVEINTAIELESKSLREILEIA